MTTATLVTSPHVRHPAVLANDFAVDQSVMYGFAPIGLLSLIASVRHTLGITPVLFDLNRRIIDGTIPLNCQIYDQAARAIAATRSKVFGFMTECDSYHHVLQIAEGVKRLCPESFIVLGGPHATAVARPTLERHAYIDAIAMGEAELSFPQLLQAVESGCLAPIPGVLCRNKSTGILDGGPSTLVDHLDSLPVPAFDLYTPDPGEEIFLEVGRGCPFPCTFCSTAPFWRRKHRVKSPARIVFEVALVQRLFNSTRVHFTHDLLTTDRNWVIDLCNTLIEAGSPVRWTCSARTDTVDDHLLDLMAAAGCNAIYFGIESGSERILREIGKDIPLDRSFGVVKSCRDRNIAPNVGFIAGFPSETEDSLRDTFDAYEKALLLDCKPAHIFGYCPFAQSSLYKEIAQLECPGHYLDLPVDGLDTRNREMVARDPELFGAYFRPQNPPLSDLILGIDEFSCLVGAVQLPTLLLAREIGGMFTLYKEWVHWISTFNCSRCAAPSRTYYGTPLLYCDFLASRLETVSTQIPHGVDTIRVMRTNLQLSLPENQRTPTSMASFRSFTDAVAPSVSLATPIGSSRVVSTLQTEFDVVPLVEAPLDFTVPERRECNLVWVRDETGIVRILDVTPFVFFSLSQLSGGVVPISELFANWLTSQRSASLVLDPAEAIAQLEEAAAFGVVSVLEYL